MPVRYCKFAGVALPTQQLEETELGHGGVACLCDIVSLLVVALPSRQLEETELGHGGGWLTSLALLTPRHLSCAGHCINFHFDLSFNIHILMLCVIILPPC